jgi:acyl dehydratase
MLNSKVGERFAALQPGADLGASPWVTVTQSMIDGFGSVTLDPDPMHIDPEWARANGPYDGTIAFGFLTISLLTHLLHSTLGTGHDRDAGHSGHYLNYGFDRLRFVAPVRAGRRIRGRFKVLDCRRDERQRLMTTFDCTVEIEGEERPALSAQWLTVWVPPDR